MARPIALTANGNAQVDTAQSKFGGASGLFDGSGDYLQFAPGGDTTNGTGDITYEGWMYLPSPSNDVLFDMRPGSNGNWPAIFGSNSSHGVWMWWNGARRLTHQTSLTANTWHHIALVRHNDVFKIYVDGVASNQSYTSSAEIPSSSYARIGANFNLGLDANGHIDEFRISSVARYTANFTPSTSAFENDADTLMLVHMDGTDASTTFTDDNSSAGVTHEGAADLSSSFTQTAQNTRTRTGSASLDSVFSPTIFAVASRNGSIDMALQTAFASDVNVNRSTDVALENIVNLSLQAARIREDAAAIAADFAATSTASATRSNSSSLAVSFEQTTTPTRIKQFGATISGVFTPSIQAVASLNGSVDLAATVDATATSTTIKQLDANLSSAFSIASTVGFEKQTSLTLVHETSLVANVIKWSPTAIGNRPRNWSVESGTPTIDNSVYTLGTGSLRVDANDKLQLLASNDFLDLKTVDFRVKLPTQQEQSIQNSAVVFFSIGEIVSGSPDEEIVFRTNNISSSGGVDRFRFVITTNGEFDDDPDNDFRSWTSQIINQNDWSNWVHVRCQLDSSGWTVWFDGVKHTPFSNNTLNEIPSEILSNNPRIGGNVSSLPAITYWIDELLLSEDLLVPTSTSTFTVPTSAYKGADTITQSNTLGLYHFDKNTFDDVSGSTRIYSADLTTTTTIVGNLGGTFGTDADLTTTAAITTDADKIVSASASIDTTATAGATASKILTATADLTAEFAQTTVVNRIRPGAAAIAGAFAQTATVNISVGAVFSDDAAFELAGTTTRIKQLNADLNAFVSTLTAAGRVSDFFIDIEPRATMQTTAQRTASAESVQNATVDLTSTAIKIHPGVVAATANITLAADGELVSGSIAQLDSNYALTATAIRAKGLIADFNSEFSATGTGQTFLGTTTFEGVVTATLNATVEVTRTTSADLTLTATQTATGIKNIEGSATLSGVFSPSITAVASRAGDIDLYAQTTADATAVKTVSTTCTAPVTASLGATGSLTKSTSVNASAQADLTATGGGLANGASELAITVGVQAQGRIVVTDRFVYTIPSENRTATIQSETRAHTVHKETRTYTLGEI